MYQSMLVSLFLLGNAVQQQVDEWSFLIATRDKKVSLVSGASAPSIEPKGITCNTLITTLDVPTAASYDSIANLVVTREHIGSKQCIRVYNSVSKLLSELRSNDLGMYSWPSVSPDGKRLAIISPAGFLIIADLPLIERSARSVLEVPSPAGASLSGLRCLWVDSTKILLSIRWTIYQVNLIDKSVAKIAAVRLVGSSMDGFWGMDETGVITSFEWDGRSVSTLSHLRYGKGFSGLAFTVVSPSGRYIAYDAPTKSGNACLNVQDLTNKNVVGLPSLGDISCLNCWTERSVLRGAKSTVPDTR